MSDYILNVSIAYAMGIARLCVSFEKHGVWDELSIVGYMKKGKEDKTMLVELNAFNLYELRSKGAVFNEEVSTIFKRMFANKSNEQITVHLKNKLLPFQLEGVSFLNIKKGRGLLADEMGLGKTMQTIGLLSAVPKRYLPVVVLCPAHIKLNWADELEEWWTDAKVEVLFGVKPYQLSSKTNVIVLNQHILKGWISELLALKPKLLVIDEGQSFVSKSTKTYTVVETLARNIGRTTILTGTPLVNKPDDLWGLCNLINPNILGGYTHFIHRFCPSKAFDYKQVRRFQKKTNVWGKPVEEPKEEEPDATDADKRLLHNILVRTCMLRRLKVNVAPQLPKKFRKVIRIKVEDRKFWKAQKELESKIRESLRSKGMKGIIDMRSYSRMRQIVGEAKLDHICEWLDEWTEANPDKKIVITGWHKDVLYKLHEKYPDSYIVTGDVSTAKKHAISKAFNAKGGHKKLFGNIKSIGTGIKLVGAATMVNVELPFTGADLEQVEARIDRLSQMAKKLYYIYFIVADSLEEKLLNYISRKQRMAGKILDNKEVVALEDIVSDAPNTELLKGLLLS